jgi:hypothetical protein
MTSLLKHAGDTENVVTPRARGLLGEVVEIEFKLAGKFFGVNHELPVWPWGDRDIGREADGRWHYEAIVVVGVLADQVDAPGCAKDPGVIAEEFLKTLSEFIYLHRRVTRDSH